MLKTLLLVTLLCSPMLTLVLAPDIFLIQVARGTPDYESVENFGRQLISQIIQHRHPNVELENFLEIHHSRLTVDGASITIPDFCKSVGESGLMMFGISGLNFDIKQNAVDRRGFKLKWKFDIWLDLNVGFCQTEAEATVLRKEDGSFRFLDAQFKTAKLYHQLS